MIGNQKSGGENAMTYIELNALEQAAKAAAQGIWYTKTTAADEETAAFISAANPKAVLELIADLRRARNDACEWINIARWLIRKFGRETVETEMIMMARHALGYENKWGVEGKAKTAGR